MSFDVESARREKAASLTSRFSTNEISRSPSQSLQGGSSWHGQGTQSDSFARARAQLLLGLQQEHQAQELQQLQGAPEPELQVASRQPSAAAQRWHHAVVLVTESRRMQHDIDQLQSRTSTPADKLAAAAHLLLRQSMWDRLLLRNPHNRLLQLYTRKKRASSYRGLWDRVDTELYLTGALIFDWCTPSKMFEHYIPFTCLYFMVVWLVFFFMAAQFPYYQAFSRARSCWPPAGVPSSGANATATTPRGLDCSSDAVWSTQQLGPDYMVAWVVGGGPAFTFSFSFMRAWGARYNPDLSTGQMHRWLTSQFVHTDLRHVLSNLLLFLALSGLMENKYGTLRVLLVWMASFLGGQLVSAALERPCIQVVGASGGVFGLVGLFAADLLLNTESVKRPILRSLGILGFLAFFLYNVFSQKYVSHVSHMGGMLCGLFAGFLFLPRLQSERWEGLLPLLGITMLLAIFVALPIYLYAALLPGLPLLCGL